jgi:7,8-dihydropterin-6-yl-methyl-4-(beta-D-ribofuranosyl)aminobenzene 5'-phosphate synthase
MVARMVSRDIVELDELRLVVVVDNEIDMLSSVGEGLPHISAAAYLTARVPPSRVHDGQPCTVVLDRLCRGGHGLSVLLTGRRGSEERTVLFDVGPYPELWTANAGRLGLELARIEAVMLSHWHFDHSGGMPDVLGAIAGARRAANLGAPVVDLHPDRPDQRGTRLPSGAMVLLPPEPALPALEAAGARVVTQAEPHALAGGFFYGSGRIERSVEYEQGLAGHHTFRGDRAEPDPLIMDERFLAARVRGRGVTIVSSCSHAGVVNVCLAARAAFPDQPIDVVLGGYHLAGREMERRIDATVRDLATRVRPRVVAPAHCTGWRAKAALAHAFAPARYAPSGVGSMYVLTAPGDASPAS